MENHVNESNLEMMQILDDWLHAMYQLPLKDSFTFIDTGVNLNLLDFTVTFSDADGKVWLDQHELHAGSSLIANICLLVVDRNLPADILYRILLQLILQV